MRIWFLLAAMTALAGCSAGTQSAGVVAPDKRWPGLGWGTNANIEPYTNKIAPPIWGPVPPPSK